MRASGSVGCNYHPSFDVYVGDGFDAKAVSAEAKAGGRVGLEAEFRATAVGCATYNFVNRSWEDARFGAGLQGTLTPSGELFAFAKASVLWKDLSFGSEDGWPVWTGGALKFLELKTRSVDPFAPSQCAIPAPLPPAK